MPVDSTIAAGVNPPAAPASMNPFDTMSKWANMQNAMNQNRLFQQTFMARQKAGQILASSPDLETGMKNLFSDPDVAPFAGETINSFRQAQLAQTQQLGELQTQAKGGLDAFMKMIPMISNDPTDETWNRAQESILRTLSPQVQSQVLGAMGSLKKSLVDGLPEDPTQKAEAFHRRWLGLMTAAGVTPESMKVLMGGEPSQLDLGGAIQPTFRTFGGQQIPTGPGYAKSLPPQVTTTTGGVPIQVGGNSGLLGPVPARPSGLTTSINGLMPGVTSNPLPSPSPSLRPSVAPGSTKSNSTSPSNSSQTAWTGKPLYNGMATSPSYQKSNLTGQPIMNEVQQEKNKGLVEKFNKEDTTEFNQAQSALGELNFMKNSMDTMAKSGGLFQPGPWADQRILVGNTMNTLASMFGMWDPTKPIDKDNKPPFDANAAANAEEFQKSSERMALSVTRTMLGNQREAAQTIENIRHAVPTVNNTYLGGRLIIGGVEAALQRSMDRYKYLQEFSNRHGGNLDGADAAFAEEHPVQEYTQKVLDQYGMNAAGKFSSKEAAAKAYHDGLIDRATAAKILRDDFGGK